MRNALTILFVFIALLVGGIARANNTQDSGCKAFAVDSVGISIVADETTAIYGDPAVTVDILVGGGVVLIDKQRGYKPPREQNLLITSQGDRATAYLCDRDSRPFVTFLPLVSR